ncbi:hypothetical protein J2X41_002458 [Caulobacter sp. BE254]|nr:hypothetical protein [Caulobacter sp. BE254]
MRRRPNPATALAPLPGRPYGAGPEQAAFPRDASGHRDIKPVQEATSGAGRRRRRPDIRASTAPSRSRGLGLSAARRVRPEICAGARNPQAFAAVDRRPMMSDSALGGAIWSTSPCTPERARDRFEAPSSDSLHAFSAADAGELADHEAPGAVTSSPRRPNRAPNADSPLGAGRFGFGDSLITDVDATAEAGVARANPLSRPRMPFRFSANVSENRAEWREPGDPRRAGRDRRGRRRRYRSSTLAPGMASTARSEGRRRPGPDRRHRSPPRISDTAQVGQKARPEDAAPAPKPKPPNGDSIGEGLSSRRHTPISAPRSETRSRPQGWEPQGSCFLWPTSLVSALQSTRLWIQAGSLGGPRISFCLFVAALALRKDGKRGG